MPNCKYIKEQEIVSYNGGVDWQDVMPAQYRKGQLIEHDSEDCTDMDTIYRWRKLTGVYMCIDDVKYEKLILDESYDGGLSWYPAYPSQYTTGEEIGVDEDYCNDKFVGQYDLEIVSTGGTIVGHECPSRMYWDGRRCVASRYVDTRPERKKDPIKIVKCDGNPELTSADTKYYMSYSNYKFSLLSAEIGKCVTSIAASAFTNSSAMTYVSMADSVTTIGAHAFRGCTSLSGMNTTTPGVLNIPSGVTSIGTSAFNGCSGITSIICEQTTPPSLGNNVFANTNNCPIYVPCGSVGSYQYSWSSLASRIAPIGGTVCDSVRVRYYYNGESSTYYCGNATKIQGADANGTGVERSAITGVSIGDCVTEIGYTALSGCGFTNIDIPSGITSIGTSAFTRCNNLTSITIPSSVTTIGSCAFKYCSGLTSCTINGGSIGTYAFEYCTSLTSCTIGSGVTSIGEYAFQSCSGLTSMTIPDGVTSVGGEAFRWCYGLRSCTIGNDVTWIGGYAFDSCSHLTNVTIGTGVTSIGGYTFQGSGLASLTIYATTPPRLGNNAFLGLSNFQIYVPASSVNTYRASSDWNTYSLRIQPIPPVTKWLATYQDSHIESAECDSSSAITYGEITSPNIMMVEIGDCVKWIAGAFEGYTSLTNVTIGNGVTDIYEEAFSGCTSLTSVIIEATTPPTLGASVFDQTNDCPIYVPAASVETYKAASGWSTYADRIQAIT